MIAVASLSSALFATQALGENVSSTDSLADSTAPVGLKEIKLQGFLPLDDGKKAPPCSPTSRAAHSAYLAILSVA